MRQGISANEKDFVMIRIFKNVQVDWLGNRRIFIFVSVLLMLLGMASTIVRQVSKGGTEGFNLGVDFKGGTVVTAEFSKQSPPPESLRASLQQNGIQDAIIQPATDRPNQVLIKVPQQTSTDSAQDQAQVDAGRSKVANALSVYANNNESGPARIIGTEAVGAVAGSQLRNQAITVTFAALIGILIYIAYRFKSIAYGAAAVIAVFHDVLITLGFFSIFQWEISLTVIAALLTLVGFSVNDTIVVFDRIRENVHLHRGDSMYKITNDAINQTLSRTIITSGLVFLSVLALVLFGGEVLRGFSLALFVGIIFGTYSSIAIASPIMVWWEERTAYRQVAVIQPSSRPSGSPSGQKKSGVRPTAPVVTSRRDAEPRQYRLR